MWSSSRKCARSDLAITMRELIGARSRTRDRYWLHALLFVLTFLSTMMAGAQWAGLSPEQFSEITNWGAGLTYALLIILFLSAHEFGHYIAARIHGVDASLPYFIPMPLILFGTMGAVIRTRSIIPSRTVLFDIGIAGPLSGFVVSLGILVYGFTHLPGIESLYVIHPEYVAEGGIPATGMFFGDTILFSAFRSWFVDAEQWMPPMNEFYHYPFLCVGWFGLFVTALNLAPFGSLDGGHILYALVGGVWQRRIARVLWWTVFTLGILSLVGIINLYLQEPSPSAFVVFLQNTIGEPLTAIDRAVPWLFHIGEGWLVWALFVRFLVKVDHPELPDQESIGTGRRVLGWMSMAILVLCMPAQIIYVVG